MVRWGQINRIRNLIIFGVLFIFMFQIIWKKDYSKIGNILSIGIGIGNTAGLGNINGFGNIVNYEIKSSDSEEVDNIEDSNEELRNSLDGNSTENEKEDLNSADRVSEITKITNKVNVNSIGNIVSAATKSFKSEKASNVEGFDHKAEDGSESSTINKAEKDLDSHVQDLSK